MYFLRKILTLPKGEVCTGLYHTDMGVDTTFVATGGFSNFILS